MSEHVGPKMFKPFVKAKLGSKVEKDAVEWAEENGWHAIKIAKTSIRGYPDRLFVKRGKHVWVEFKGPKEPLLKNQEERIKDLTEAGADVFVCRDLATFKWRMA